MLLPRASVLTAIFAGAAVMAVSFPLECSSGTMTTLTYGDKGALYTVCAEAFIPASPEAVYDAVLDFSKYPEWNTFVTSVDLPANVSSSSDVYVDMPMTFHTSGVLPGLPTTSGEQITFLQPEADPPYVAWKFNPGPLIQPFSPAEHVCLFIPTNGGTKHVSWETFYVPGAILTAPLKKNLQDQFEQQVKDLTQRVQSLGQ